MLFRKLPIINHHYTIKYKEVKDFSFSSSVPIVNISTYKDKVIPKLDTIIQHLKQNKNSRQEVIIVNNEWVHNSCLISLQFQTVEDTLVLIANYRSQDTRIGKTYDRNMLRYLCTLVLTQLPHTNCTIHINVGNYHHNTHIQEF